VLYQLSYVGIILRSYSTLNHGKSQTEPTPKEQARSLFNWRGQGSNLCSP
jgi:hypothetical protein